MNILPMNHHHRRGVAMMMAIAMLGLVAVCVACIAHVIESDARRTTQMQHDTVARQLHLSSAQAALVQLRDQHRISGPIALPDELSTAGFSAILAWEPAGDQCVAIMSIDRQTQRQKLKFTSTAGHWQLVRIEPLP